MTPVSNERGSTALLHAVLDCPHTIEGGEIVLRLDPKRQGNATAQLHDRIDFALRSQSPEPSSSEVRVKPLEWENGSARSAIGDLYGVVNLGGSIWQVRWNGTAFTGWYSSQSEARAAAEADYERRIRSALSPTVSQPASFEDRWLGDGDSKHVPKPPTVSQPGTGEGMEVAFDPKDKSDAIAIAIASIDGEKWVRLSDYQALKAERDEAARIARDMTKALVDLTPGGSEYFTRCTMLDTYFADIEQCTRVIRERFQSGHQAKIDRVDERRRAEAAEARLSAVEGALRNIEDMIDNCAGVPRNPDSLPMMVLEYVRQTLTTITGGENER